MRHIVTLVATCFSLPGLLVAPVAHGYVLDYTAPKAGGCPQPNRFLTGSGIAINRRWSTSLPSTQTIFTLAAPGTATQLDEIEQTVLESFAVWTGVAGTTLSAGTFPSALAPLQRTATQNACANDQGTNLSGLNTICFNQSSAAFTTGVLAFTRTITADAPGETLGSSGPSSFAGQILEADILLRNDSQATFATPGALASHASSYDLESILIHELGHFFGMDHSTIWQTAMFPFAPAPGTFLGDRPTVQAADTPLADDDRTGLRALYPDPNDTLNVGVIAGHVLPANPLSLALVPQPSAAQWVTGIFGAHAVVVDADTGAVVAGALAGWSCEASNPVTRFDGSYRIERLPLGRNYSIYVEPLNGAVLPSQIASATQSICRQDGPTPCAPPPVNTNFVTRAR